MHKFLVGWLSGLGLAAFIAVLYAFWKQPVKFEQPSASNNTARGATSSLVAEATLPSGPVDTTSPTNASGGTFSSPDPSIWQQDLIQRLKVKQEAHRGALIAPLVDILSSLPLTDSKRAEAIKIITDHQALLDDRFISAVSGASPPSVDELLRQDEQVDRRLKAALGEQQFNEFKFRKDTLPEQLAMDRIEQRLSNANMPITEADKSRLFEIMVDAVAPAEENAPRQISTPTSHERLNRISQAISQQTNMLSDAQRTIVEDFFEQTREMRRGLSGRGVRP